MASSHIAQLGYVVDTSPLKKAERSLDDVTVAGKKTEKGTKGVSAGCNSVGSGASIAALSIARRV